VKQNSKGGGQKPPGPLVKQNSKGAGGAGQGAPGGAKPSNQPSKTNTN